MRNERYVENDVGRALTADQMAEYQEACDAKAEGRESKRLKIAADVGLALLVGGAAVGVVWGATH